MGWIKRPPSFCGLPPAAAAIAAATLLLVAVAPSRAQSNFDRFFDRRLGELLAAHLPYPTDRPTDRPAWIDRITVRTKTDEFRPERQEYVLRVAPTTPRIRRARLKTRDLLRERAALETDLLRAEWVDRAYAELLELYRITHELELQRQLLDVLRDQERVWRRLLVTSENPKDWLDVQRAILRLEEDVLRNETRRAELLPDGTTIPPDSLVAPAAVRTFVVEHLERTSAVPFLELQQRYDRDLLEQELELETAERRRIFDFLETEYNGPHSDPWRERVSLTASFELSVGGNSWLKTQELAVERELLEREQRTERELVAYERTQLARRIVRRVEVLERSRARGAAQQRRTEARIRSAAGREGTTPLLQLYQRERVLEERLEELEREVDIYEAYLDYLSTTLLLYETPVRNYLAR